MKQLDAELLKTMAKLRNTYPAAAIHQALWDIERVRIIDSVMHAQRSPTEHNAKLTKAILRRRLSA